jgi:hypothetical protein
MHYIDKLLRLQSLHYMYSMCWLILILTFSFDLYYTVLHDCVSASLFIFYVPSFIFKIYSTVNSDDVLMGKINI